MQLIISPLAETDIESIGDYIALDNPQRALLFINELYLQCQKIGEMPELYAKNPILHKDIRICPYGRYLIIFTTKNQQVRIERVLHGARDLHSLINNHDMD